MNRRDLFTPIGIFLGFLFIYIAISIVGGIQMLPQFFSFSSILIVLGGIVASIFVGFGAHEVRNAIKVVRKTFSREELQIEALITFFVELLRAAKKKGAFDGVVDKPTNITDPFISQGISLIMDGIDPVTIQEILETEIDALQRRHTRVYEIINKAGRVAPAWGLVGTIISLIIALNQFDTMRELGPEIAGALITAFYGIVLSQLVFYPIANKLAKQSEDEIFMKRVVLTAILSVRKNESVVLLREKLQSFITDAADYQLQELAKETMGHSNPTV
jgi:chemotaxis protein MotA